MLEGIAVQLKRGPNKDRYELKTEYKHTRRPVGAGQAAEQAEQQ